MKVYQVVTWLRAASDPRAIAWFPGPTNWSWAWASVGWTSVDPDEMVEKEGELDKGKRRVKGQCHGRSLVGHVC